MSQAAANEVLSKKPKRRVEWVQKRLREELATPGLNRDVLYEVLTRKEGRAFAQEVSANDAVRVYGAIQFAMDLFTVRQQKQLQAQSYYLRQMHDKEQARTEETARVAKAKRQEASAAKAQGSSPPATGASGSSADKAELASARRRAEARAAFVAPSLAAPAAPRVGPRPAPGERLIADASSAGVPAVAPAAAPVHAPAATADPVVPVLPADLGPLEVAAVIQSSSAGGGGGDGMAAQSEEPAHQDDELEIPDWAPKTPPEDEEGMPPLPVPTFRPTGLWTSIVREESSVPCAALATTSPVAAVAAPAPSLQSRSRSRSHSRTAIVTPTASATIVGIAKSRSSPSLQRSRPRAASPEGVVVSAVHSERGDGRQSSEDGLLGDFGLASPSRSSSSSSAPPPEPSAAPVPAEAPAVASSSASVVEAGALEAKASVGSKLSPGRGPVPKSPVPKRLLRKKDLPGAVDGEASASSSLKELASDSGGRLPSPRPPSPVETKNVSENGLPREALLGDPLGLTTLAPEKEAPLEDLPDPLGLAEQLREQQEESARRRESSAPPSMASSAGEEEMNSEQQQPQMTIRRRVRKRKRRQREDSHDELPRKEPPHQRRDALVGAVEALRPPTRLTPAPLAPGSAWPPVGLSPFDVSGLPAAMAPAATVMHAAPAWPPPPRPAAPAVAQRPRPPPVVRSVRLTQAPLAEPLPSLLDEAAAAVGLRPPVAWARPLSKRSPTSFDTSFWKPPPLPAPELEERESFRTSVGRATGSRAAAPVTATMQPGAVPSALRQRRRRRAGAGGADGSGGGAVVAGTGEEGVDGESSVGQKALVDPYLELQDSSAGGPIVLDDDDEEEEEEYKKHDSRTKLEQKHHEVQALRKRLKHDPDDWAEWEDDWTEDWAPDERVRPWSSKAHAVAAEMAPGHCSSVDGDYAPLPPLPSPTRLRPVARGARTEVYCGRKVFLAAQQQRPPPLREGLHLAAKLHDERLAENKRQLQEMLARRRALSAVNAVATAAASAANPLPRGAARSGGLGSRADVSKRSRLSSDAHSSVRDLDVPVGDEDDIVEIIEPVGKTSRTR